MKTKFKLTTPVLYLIFNRLDTVKQTFPEIQKAKPKQLFIGADGPRTKQEKEKTDAVREYILKNINWKCEVKILFKNKNLGCNYAVSGAIDWFFENVEQGIILEDDCLPDQSFFRFCQEMLEKYKENKKIMSISGYNPLGVYNIDESYLFSKYFYCWGWATWRRAWKLNDLEMKEYINIKKLGILKEYLPGFFERIFYKKKFNQNVEGKINSWDASFSFSQIFYKKLSIIPKANLIQNLGFSNLSSTHTRESYWDKKYLCYERMKIEFPLIYPNIIKEDKKFDKNYIFLNIKRVFLKKIF